MVTVDYRLRRKINGNGERAAGRSGLGSCFANGSDCELTVEAMTISDYI